MSIDILGNFLTIIRNGIARSKSSVTAPYSSLKYDNLSNQLNLIDVKLLKETIYDYCLERITGSVLDSIQLNKLVRDLVFVFTLFGNDFLPKSEAIQTNQDFLFLIDMYLINLINYYKIYFIN